MNQMQTTPLNPMQTLILDLAAAIDDPCGADEIRLARIAVKLLIRTHISQRSMIAESLENLGKTLNVF